MRNAVLVKFHTWPHADAASKIWRVLGGPSVRKPQALTVEQRALSRLRPPSCTHLRPHGERISVALPHFKSTACVNVIHHQHIHVISGVTCAVCALFNVGKPLRTLTQSQVSVYFHWWLISLYSSAECTYNS